MSHPKRCNRIPKIYLFQALKSISNSVPCAIGKRALITLNFQKWQLFALGANKLHHFISYFSNLHNFTNKWLHIIIFKQITVTLKLQRFDCIIQCTSWILQNKLFFSFDKNNLKRRFMISFIPFHSDSLNV